MQFSSSVPSGQSCQPSHTDSSARHSPFPQENSAGLQVSGRGESRECSRANQPLLDHLIWQIQLRSQMPWVIWGIMSLCR